jgi:hypothetical protein
MWQLQEMGLLHALIDEKRDVDQVTRRATRLSEWLSSSIQRDEESVLKRWMLDGLESARVGPAYAISLPSRQKALSLLTAERARNQARVAIFRRNVLHERLLRSDEVERWVCATKAAEGAESVWHELPLPDGTDLGTLCENAGSDQPVRTPQLRIPMCNAALLSKRHLLHYLVPDRRSERRVATNAWGNLEQLRDLSRELARLYPWTEAQAATLVLTDEPPVVERISGKRVRRMPPGLTRINLSIDPSATPREVGESYRRQRQAAFGRRIRRLSEKHAELAHFRANKHKLGKAELAEWNSKYSNWRYGRLSNFSRDAKKATERVLGGKIGAELGCTTSLGQARTAN